MSGTRLKPFNFLKPKNVIALANAKRNWMVKLFPGGQGVDPLIQPFGEHFSWLVQESQILEEDFIAGGCEPNAVLVHRGLLHCSEGEEEFFPEPPQRSHSREACNRREPFTFRPTVLTRLSSGRIKFCDDVFQ